MLNDIEGEFVGGFAGELTKGGYNCVELGTTVSPFGGGHYMEKNVPITVCNVLGGYRGNDEKYSNIYYNEGDRMAVQFGKKHYEKLLKNILIFLRDLMDYHLMFVVFSHLIITIMVLTLENIIRYQKKCRLIPLHLL